MSGSMLDMVVEIPQGGRNKYEVDHTTGRVRLDRTLRTWMTYPADYGFIENTLAEDGDPLDALVFLDEPCLPGVVITVRPVGVFHMEDENGSDDKLLVVPAHDTYWDHLQDIDDVPSMTKDAISHFFAHYKDLEASKFVIVHGFGSKAEAETLVTNALRAYADSAHQDHLVTSKPTRLPKG
ncbi:MAG TPA: inorganic diphosphatase [Thermomicrobiales bacterium]|nr:inorganic diphosphatase [Thermomicrobiales bacterium]